MSIRYTTLLIVLWLFFLAAFMNPTHLVPDSYYYWVWSRHLDSSYFDGPPLIAYVFRLITLLFGNSEFSLSLLGWLTVSITSFLIYRCGFLLFKNERIAYLAVIFWIFSTGVIRHLLIWITYDDPLMIFWACTFYFFLKLLQTQKTQHYYFTGLSIGLMLLAKYTGILLCVSMLLYCLLYVQYRFVFKSIHFYQALLLAALLFSPVLFWNMQHHWISFYYQLNHGFNGNPSLTSGVVHYFLVTLFDFNVFFLALVFIFCKHFFELFRSKNLAVIAIPTLLVWVFFFISSFKSFPGGNWNMPAFFTGSLIIAYYFEHYRVTRWAFALLIILATIPTIIYCKSNGTSMSGQMSEIFSKVPAKIYQDRVLYHTENTWLPSYASYFLPGQPNVYGSNIHTQQFYFLYRSAQPSKTGDRVVVIAYHPSVADKHFSQCHVVYQNTKYSPLTVYFLDCRYSTVTVS